MTSLTDIIAAALTTTYASAIVLAVLAWLVILPTVGMLYAFGVLP